MAGMKDFGLDSEYLRESVTTHGYQYARDLAAQYAESYFDPGKVYLMFLADIDRELARLR